MKKELFDKNVLFDVIDFGEMNEAEMDEYVSEKMVTYTSYLYVRVVIGIVVGALLIGVPSVMVFGIEWMSFILMGGMLGGAMARAHFGNKKERAVLRLQIYERNRLEKIENSRKTGMDRKKVLETLEPTYASVTYLDNEKTREYRTNQKDYDN